MLVLGLLLIAGAALITVGAFFDAGETATVEILGQTLSTTAAGVFVIGAMTMLVFLLGVWCLMAGMTRSRRKRVERKQARTQHRDSVRSLEDERETLRLENERLAEQLRAREHAGATAGTAGAAGAAGAAGGAAATDRDHDHDHDGVDDRTEPGHRSFMDRVTGRHDSGSTTGSTSESTAGSTVPTGTASDDGHSSDRVIDHETDLRAHDSTSTGHHREV
jgi:ABC-type nickel/cobalt efflux system permease component RcnA